ncbi:MAG: hypothetical protein HC809_15175, partial [Gammaproteobacteria bacterium]|nr:hypothetical protein [Gammaproteobacteria bacterium]
MESGSTTARALIVAHDARKLHVIAPQDCLVDLFALARHVGGAVRVERAEPLEFVASAPGTYEHPLILDDRLLRADAIDLNNEAGHITRVDAR